MRILFATTRGAGHVGPLIPFAHACLAAGHDVRMAAAPSAEPHVRRAGLPFAALDEPDPEVMAALWPRVKAATPEEAGRMVFEEVFAGEFARSALPGMLRLAYRWRPDVIVRETCEFASPLVAEAVGVPDVHVACFLAVLGNTDWDLYKPLGRLRKEFALAPSSRDRSIEPYLTLAPRSLEHPAFVEIPGDAAVPRARGPATPVAGLVERPAAPARVRLLRLRRRGQRVLPRHLPRRGAGARRAAGPGPDDAGHRGRSRRSRAASRATCTWSSGSRRAR